MYVAEFEVATLGTKLTGKAAQYRFVPSHPDFEQPHT
jgi:hypothetical protein